MPSGSVGAVPVPGGERDRHWVGLVFRRGRRGCRRVPGVVDRGRNPAASARPAQPHRTSPSQGSPPIRTTLNRAPRTATATNRRAHYRAGTAGFVVVQRQCSTRRHSVAWQIRFGRAASPVRANRNWAQSGPGFRAGIRPGSGGGRLPCSLDSPAPSVAPPMAGMKQWRGVRKRSAYGAGRDAGPSGLAGLAR